MQPLNSSATGAEILDKHGETIERMCTQDTSFQELWNDYIEVAKTIDSRRLDERDEVELGRLRAALEAEILENLSLFKGRPDN
jgi:hypothetical protein